MWHDDDEAISALYNVKFVNGPINPSTFLVPFVAIAPLLVMVLAMFYAAFYLLGGRATCGIFRKSVSSSGNSLEALAKGVCDTTHECITHVPSRTNGGIGGHLIRLRKSNRALSNKVAVIAKGLPKK